MFNGYHEPSATSYNDLELERGKKTQSASKWTCGNGTNLQSTHLHPQNQQPEIWVSKPPFIGLPNTASAKCNCPSCYQLPESQCYQGEIPWQRSWFSRTYPVALNATQDLVKLPTNHHWENASFPNDSYPETAGGQFVQESGDKPLFYKPYSGIRHDMYQPGVISTVKKVSRKQDLLKQDEVMPNTGHPRYAVSNSGYDSFRSAIDQRIIEERTSYRKQNEKFLNSEACRQQGGLGLYGLNPSRRTILESFSKTVPLNTNQNRVPSVGHHNVKDNDFHSCIDQNDTDKPGPYNINHGASEDKHCRTHFQSDVNPGLENLHSGLINAFSSASADCHGINLNRELSEGTDKDFQKFVNDRNPQYFPRNNISDVMNRNPNSVLNYNINRIGDINRKGVINITSGSARAAQTPPKHAEVMSNSPNFGKDCTISDKMSPGQKLIMNNNVNIPPERFHKGNEIPRSENIIHGHITRPVVGTNPPDRTYNSVSPQSTEYKGYRRPQDYSYGRRNIHRPNDYSNGTINLRNDLPVGINVGLSNFPDHRKSLDTYPPANNAFPHDRPPHHFEKLHYQLSSDNKPQSSLFGGSQLPQKVEILRETEKESPCGISHLEAIPYDELCKNGTSKISPLRLLRKKKLVPQKKENAAETVALDTVANAKSASPPLDVRRFWATWAEEEEDNVLQTQMVVLDCHNIDPEQAGLLNLYNSENIRTVNLEDENVVGVKGTHFQKVNDQDASVNDKTWNLDEKLNTVRESERVVAIAQNDVKISVSNTNIGKTQTAPDFSLDVPLIVDPGKEAVTEKEIKTNIMVQPNPCRSIGQCHPSEDVKQFDIFRHNETNWDDLQKPKHSDIEKPVLTKSENISAEISDKKIDGKKSSEVCAGVSKEELLSSDASDDSQTGDLPVLPDLPTSEYRKNKFLDYSDDNFCNGTFLLEGVTYGSNKEAPVRKQIDESDCHIEEKLKDFLSSKPSEIGPGSFEIDDILKKLSDINFQGTDIKAGSPNQDDSPDKYKTDKKILESKKEKKIKRVSHKPSRTDQVTLQNISLTKPTIKFSIQKSHDLKISFKVLNNKKKYDEKEDDAQSDEDHQVDLSPEYLEEGEITDRLKKHKRRLITLKLKGVSEENGEGNSWEEDSIRRSKKGFKKKKVRSDRSPSPKTPVLKIKKSRYMLTYGPEGEEVREACKGATDDASKSSENEGAAHGDFQVHETVDSAKIKLTFKRNKNGGDRREKCDENDEVMDVKGKSSCSENELTSVTNLCLKSFADTGKHPNGCEPMALTAYLKDEIEPKEGFTDSTVKEEEASNNDSGEESGSTSKNCELSADSETVESLCNIGEDIVDDFKKDYMVINSLDIVGPRDNTPSTGDLNSLQGHYSEKAPEVEQCETSGKNTKKDPPGLEMNSLSLGEVVLAIDGECEAIDKNAKEMQNAESESFSSLSKLDAVTENCEFVYDKPNEEDYTERSLNCVVRESFIDSFELLLEHKIEEITVKTEEKQKVGETSLVVNADKDQKNLEVSKEDYCDAHDLKYEDIILNTTKDEETCEQPSVCSDAETADTTKQHEYQGSDGTDSHACTKRLSNSDGPSTEVNLVCDIDLNEGMTEPVSVSNSVELLPAGNNHSSEEPQPKVNIYVVVRDESDPDRESVHTSETIKEVENSSSVMLTNIDIKAKENSDEICDEDMQVELCQKEQNDSEMEQIVTKEPFSEGSQTEEENAVDCAIYQDIKSGIEDIIEENNNIRLYRKETAFVRRKILRRCSGEDTICGQETNMKRVTRRSMSLNIELTVAEGTKSDITVLGIAVSDIPLPPGNAPPENCLNLEEYFRSKLLQIERKVDIHDDVSVVASPQMLQGSKPVPKLLTVVQDADKSQEEKPYEPVSGEDMSSDVGQSIVNKREQQFPNDESVTVGKEEVIGPAVESGQKDSEKSPDSEETTEIRLEDLGVFETGDTGITLEETSFRTDKLYECEGLAFDEVLTISDEMEEEKVSDDDKFRNIMQNCLDNAKKFLSVGNLKLLSCSVNDLEVDDVTNVKKSNGHVSKDVLLTSCEESDSFILPNSRHQSLDLSLDFVPSFCMDAGSNPCSEILPVDNWPYLEEEVASSPVANKTDDSDLLCYLNGIPPPENLIVEGKFSAEKFKQQKALSHTDFSSERNARSIAGRRRTIEGVGRWRAFRSMDEEISDAENLILDGNKNIKTLSTEFLRNPKKSGQIYTGTLKKKIKPYSDDEGSGIGGRKAPFKRTSAYYKSSSWQPKVVLFRMSKNKMDNLSVLSNKNSPEFSSVGESKPAEGSVDRSSDGTNGGRTCNSIPSRKLREYHIENDPEKTWNVGTEKPIENGADGIRRKKNRFRNLHTKKRIVPESNGKTKENKSAADNSSNLVDSESDSDESSPSCDPPKEIVHSHNKSTKSSSFADVPNPRPRAEEDLWTIQKRDPCKVTEKYREKRKRDTPDTKHEIENQCKRERHHPGKRKHDRYGERSKSENLKFRREAEKCWVCEVCGFSKTSERTVHIQSHPFHCQSCHLAFKTETNFVEHLTRKHKDIRNQHHCLLCELSFDLEKEYYRHLETREHRHLESVEKNTINTLFRLLTGQPCPVLGPVESKPEWLPSQAGTVHFYHQATPLSLALQYLKLHHDKKKISTAALSPSE